MTNDELDRTALLILFSWEAGGLTLEVTAEALGLTREQLFTFETQVAEAGRTAAETRIAARQELLDE